jgi:hypothetical protein
MDWHEAYLTQARSEYAVSRKLGEDVEHCHHLHYLQMVSEKLAKGILTPSGSMTPAPMSHVMFVRMLKAIKGRPDIRQQLGYRSVDVFRSYIDSLLDLAWKIERLSPEQAGLTQPNPEYPWWKDPGKTQVMAPAQYDFPEFDQRNRRMGKIDRLIGALLRLAI